MGDVIYTDTFTASSRKRPRRIVLFVIILLLLTGAGFGYFAIQSATTKKSVAEVTVPTPTEFAFPTDTPVPSSGTPTPIVSISPTPPKTTPSPSVSLVTPTANPVDAKTKLDRAALKVSVQNGSGEVGAATKASDFMKSFGYHVVAVGNADKYDYEDVTISVKEASAAYLPLLKADIAKQYTVSSSAADLAPSVAADAVVIFGK